MSASNLSMDDLMVDYVTARHGDDLVRILKETDVTKHYSVVINALLLFEEHMEMSLDLWKRPTKFLPRFDRALLKASENVYENHQSQTKMTLKRHLHARVSGLPLCPELSREFLPKAVDVGLFLSISGTVTRVGLPKLLELEKEYRCNQCKHTFLAKADLERFFVADKPRQCPNPGRCSSTKFTSSNNHDPQHLRDYQEIKIQEHVQSLTVRTVPRTAWIILEDDLVDSCQPGDDVTVVGTVVCRWQPLNQGSKCNMEYAVLANYIQANNDCQLQTVVTDEVKEEFRSFWARHRHRPLVGRDEILAHFCPQIYGLYQVKLAVALVLAGGVPKVNESGTRIRGDCHLLLIGDPGTGKSLLLKYAAKICPRSVFTNGIGSTSAGLTVTAVKDGGEWQLEAGALVLADGGLCCIDEFSSMREHDRASILEAMEQQTISVAKAGILCKMSSQCTILAATNPKGNYDPNSSISVNVALASPLLSRFDLILVLLDSKNNDWHRLISSCMFKGYDESSEANRKQSSSWSLDKMRCYFCSIKQLKPTLTPAAHVILQRYYVYHRQTETRNASRTTVRMLDSLIRLSEAHARLMFRSEVTVVDAVVAVTVMEASLQGTSCLNEARTLSTVFPEDPELEYRKQLQTVLDKLQLNDIMAQELDGPDQVNRPSHVSSVPSYGSRVDVFNFEDNHVLVDGEDGALDASGRVDGELEGVQRPNRQRPSNGPSMSRVTQQLRQSTDDDDDRTPEINNQSQNNNVDGAVLAVGKDGRKKHLVSPVVTSDAKKMRLDHETPTGDCQGIAQHPQQGVVAEATINKLRQFSFQKPNATCGSDEGLRRASDMCQRRDDCDDQLSESDLNLSWLD